MMHCPKCQTAAHAKSSRYISRETKERYHQCQNINCSCTFKTHESIAGIIVEPGQINRVQIYTQHENQPNLFH
ncbi:ogr/Delta-like zinc finger family protein [Pantoea sp. 3_1284]|uniref:ogr/Delta-like zinc finger family protein n=1 Tax=Pantoea sp. 3_1284 TaxID=2259618 RepID=UPI0009006D85|nr:ogr/Delta-like zinc finger family protein [Pantoea sp. 3_1284]RBO11538.1 transcriptional regulator [Pantoea sp. 3_1284]